MIVVNQPPIRIKPIVDSGPMKDYFSVQWEDWFLSVWKSFANRVVPVSAAFQGSYAGGGAAKDIHFDITLPQDSAVIILCNSLQGYNTTPPTWQIQIKIDATIVVDTNAIGNWQQTVSLAYETTLTKGIHTIHMIWQGGSANGLLLRGDIIAIPSIL